MNETTPATFTVRQTIETGYTRFDFVHGGGVARNTKVHLGILIDGIARSGDGWDAGDTARDLLAILIDPAEIDQSTVRADYTAGFTADARIAVFLTWSSGTDELISAAGIDTTFTKADGFAMGRTLEGADAREFLVDAGMLDVGDLRATPAEGDPEGRYFDKLKVEGYRGFAAEKSLRFARPTGSPGSGLTLLVGANNSGKSTFIEAIQLSARARNQADLNFPQPRRHRDLDSVSIELSREDGRRLSIRSIRPGGSQATATWLPEDIGPGKFDIQVTPARRSFNPYFGNSGVGDRDWGLMDQEFSRTQTRDNFVGRLRKVDRDAAARLAFDGLLEEIIGEPLEWTIDEMTTSQQFVKMIDAGGAWHTSEGLGDGLVSLLFIVDALYDSAPGSLIAIDEPELSLHPQLVRRLRRVLSRYAADRQIVVATHSPLLIDWTDIRSGATVARTFKAGGRSEVAQASNEILQKTALLADDRNLSNPHTVGAIAREALFLEDGIILTEGQDDVAYLPRVLADLGLDEAKNVYGWGSGGATNIPTLARLFRELGFTRIAAILDDDGQPGTREAEALLEAMAPEVLVRCIPAPDIRYKKKVSAKDEVVGLLEKGGTRVRDEVREAAAQVLQEVLDHVGKANADSRAQDTAGEGEKPSGETLEVEPRPL